MSDYDVLVIGRSCVDYIAVVDTFPRENTKVALKQRLVEGGGQGGTAAACIARLGGHVGYIGRVGDDDAGRICLQRLSAFNVDTRRVQIFPGGRTPEAYIFVTDGRQGAYYFEERQLVQVPAPRVTVRDTTGAGDNFHAALALALSRGDGLREAVRLGGPWPPCPARPMADATVSLPWKMRGPWRPRCLPARCDGLSSHFVHKRRPHFTLRQRSDRKRYVRL